MLKDVKRRDADFLEAMRRELQRAWGAGERPTQRQVLKRVLDSPAPGYYVERERALWKLRRMRQALPVQATAACAAVGTANADVIATAANADAAAAPKVVAALEVAEENVGVNATGEAVVVNAAETADVNARESTAPPLPPRQALWADLLRAWLQRRAQVPREDERISLDHVLYLQGAPRWYISPLYAEKRLCRLHRQARSHHRRSPHSRHDQNPTITSL